MYHFFKYPFEGYKPVKYVVNPVRVVEAVLCIMCLALAAAIDSIVHDMYIAFKIILTMTAAAFVIITVYDVIATSYMRPLFWNAWTLFAITGTIFFFLCAGVIIATGFGHVLLILGVVANAVTAIIFLLDTILILHAFKKKQTEVYPEEYEAEPIVVIQQVHQVTAEPSKSALRITDEEKELRKVDSKISRTESKHKKDLEPSTSKEIPSKSSHQILANASKEGMSQPSRGALQSSKEGPSQSSKEGPSQSSKEGPSQSSKEGPTQSTKEGPSQSSKDTQPESLREIHVEPGSSKEIDSSALSKDLAPGSSREIQILNRTYETKRTVHDGRLTEDEKIVEQRQRATTSYGGTFHMSKDAAPLPSPDAPCICRTPSSRKRLGIRGSGSQIIKRSTSGNVRKGPDGRYYLSDGTPLIELEDENGEILYQDGNGVMYTKDGIPIISLDDSYTETVKENTQQQFSTRKLKYEDGVWYTPDGQRIANVYKCCDGKLVTADGTPLIEIDVGGGSFIYESPQGVLYSSDGTPIGFENDREKEVNRLYERQTSKYTTKSETKFQERRVGEPESSEDVLYLCDGTPSKKIETPSGQILYEYNGQLYTLDDDDLPRQKSEPVWKKTSPQEPYASRQTIQSYDPKRVQSRCDSSRQQFKSRENLPPSDHSVPRSTRSSTPSKAPCYEGGSDHRSIPRSNRSLTPPRVPCYEDGSDHRSIPRSNRSLTPPRAPCYEGGSDHRSIPRSNRSLTPPRTPCYEGASDHRSIPKSNRSLTPPRDQTPIPKSTTSLTPSRAPCYESGSSVPVTPAGSYAPHGKLQVCAAQKQESSTPTCPYLPKPKPMTPRYCPAQTCMKPQKRPSPPPSPKKEKAPCAGSRTVAVSTRMVPKCPMYKQSQSAPTSPQRKDAPPRPVKSAEPGQGHQWQQQPTVVHQQYVQKPCVCGNVHYQQATTVHGTFSQPETPKTVSPPKSPNKGGCGKKDCTCQLCKNSKEVVEPSDKPPLQTISECDVETEPSSRHNIQISPTSSSQPTSSDYVPDRTSPSCTKCYICGDKNCLIHSQKETGNDSVQTSETRMLRASDIQKLTSNLPGTADDYKK
ncbi:uncharacterized protein LOC123004334 [Tribolium madens]|uniref:uncharacterized protein LOC123004334 n=1 Tax=Tribolium madens TaxID=41895 RepID=UPI001CF7506D|nr:uncharacterized protein LOC123004334 [Tribolium madens]